MQMRTRYHDHDDDENKIVHEHYFLIDGTFCWNLKQKFSVSRFFKLNQIHDRESDKNQIEFSTKER